MGNFRYCCKCGSGLSAPTAYDDLGNSGQECPQCGATQPQYQGVEEYVVDLERRVNEAETRLQKMEVQLAYAMSKAGIDALDV